MYQSPFHPTLRIDSAMKPTAGEEKRTGYYDLGEKRTMSLQGRGDGGEIPFHHENDGGFASLIMGQVLGKVM
jgi:hypothetical protein